MIKLIASDLDGTLLLEGRKELTQRQTAAIRGVMDKGIIFAAASGRPCKSLENLFAPAGDGMLYIAENGALIKYRGQILAKWPMTRELAIDIAKDIYAREGCEVLISGEVKSYIRPKSEAYLHRMTQVVKYDCKVIQDFDEIEEDIIKVAVCNMSGIEADSGYFHSRWDDVSKCAVSGPMYMDFTMPGINKGVALRAVQELLKIKPEECMAFGDNFNDVEMLNCVEYPCVMNNAVAAMKQHGKYIVDNVESALEHIILNY